MDFSDLSAAFLDELDEQLELMEQGILQLEQMPPSETAVQDLFRAAHTIKGAAAVMEFEPMKDLTHHMEYVLDDVRSHRLTVKRGMIDLLFECLDQLRSLKDGHANHESVFPDVTPLVVRLNGIKEQKDAPATRPKSETELDASTHSRLQDSIANDYLVYELVVTFEDDVLVKAARAKLVLNSLDEIGEVAHYSPDIELQNLQDEEWGALHVWCVTQEPPDLVERRVRNCGEVKEVTIQSWTPDKKPHEAVVQGAPKTAPVQEQKRAKPSESQSEPDASSVASTKRQAQAQTVRVDVSRLENLMNLVGELVIDRTRIDQIGHALGRSYSSVAEIKDLESISGHMSRTVGELQENVMKARMLPIERVLTRFPRMVRSLAEQLHKDVELVMQGQETQLDRTLIDEIADPLIHLIRNAVDHGIEAPDERVNKGKKSRGILRVTAGHAENHITIVVEDDGRGIHPEKMRESAIRKGLITAGEASSLTDEEAQNLIFKPGFSTADEVTDISGRGVGMDIVRANIEKLQGTIQIESQVDQGTRFVIQLPLTLAIVQGLLVRASKQTFVIPITSVVEIIREPLNAIQSVHGKAVMRVRGQTLPVRWLHDEFAIERPETSRSSLPIVVLSSGNRTLGFVVDELKGNQEIVKKSLGEFVGNVPGISGCTILGDGRVAMIVDAPDLCREKSGGDGL